MRADDVPCPDADTPAGYDPRRPYAPPALTATPCHDRLPRGTDWTTLAPPRRLANVRAASVAAKWVVLVVGTTLALLAVITAAVLLAGDGAVWP